MIGTAVVAVTLALPGGLREIDAILSFVCAAMISASWLIFRNQRRVAAISFVILATLVNLIYAAACTALEFPLQLILSIGWLFIVAPILTSQGSAWAALATRTSAQPRRTPAAA